MKSTFIKNTLLPSMLVTISIFSTQFAIAEAESATPEPTEIIKQQKSPWLGVWIEKLPISLNQHLSTMLKQNQGLIIKKVAPNSPAAKASLLSYDIIITIDDKDIFTEQQLIESIRQNLVGKTVKLGIIRQGKLLTQDVVLETSPDRKQLSSTSSYFSPNSSLNSEHHQGMGMRPFSAPWMNEPFFKHGFGNDFFDQQFKNMQRQLYHLKQQQQQLQQNQKQYLQQQNSWSQFESIQVESTGNGQLRAIVKYNDGDGNNKEFKFEGDHNEIHKQIKANTQMNEDKKRNLLRALDMNHNNIYNNKSN